MTVSAEWVEVQHSRDRWTKRFKVPSGWLYLVTELSDDGFGILKQSLAFVPAPKGEN